MGQRQGRGIRILERSQAVDDCADEGGHDDAVLHAAVRTALTAKARAGLLPEA